MRTNNKKERDLPAVTGKSLFDGLVLPDGIDPDTLKSNIFMQGGEFEVLYSNPDIMRNMVSRRMNSRELSAIRYQ